MVRLSSAAESGSGGRDDALHREVKLAPHAQVAQTIVDAANVTRHKCLVASHTSPEADDEGRAAGRVERVCVGGGRSSQQLRPHARTPGDTCIFQ